MKTEPKGPDASRKPGKEGLPYKSAEAVIGAPPDNQTQGGLGDGHEVKGGKAPK